MKKGNWYYEAQILMIVIMWKHSSLFLPPPKRKYSFHWGRLYIWIDPVWFYHGFGRKLNHFVWRITMLGFIRFLKSLSIFLHLYRAGFDISRHKTANELEIYRFHWNEKPINDFPDIDCNRGFYTTVRNGHVERLSKGIADGQHR